MPEIVYEKKEAIPAGLEKAATEKDGKWTVNVVAKSELDEFRNNNIALAQERDEWKGKAAPLIELVGEDIPAFKTDLSELRATAQQVKDGKLKTTKDIESEVERRVKGAQDQMTAREAALVKAADDQKSRGDKFEGLFKQSVRNQGVTNAVLAKDSGINPQALPDILRRAEGVFVVEEDGSLVAREGGKPDGKIMYGEDAKSSMSPKEWLTKLVAEAPYLGLSNTGGGADGSEAGKQRGGLSAEAFSTLPAGQRRTIARKAQGAPA